MLWTALFIGLAGSFHCIGMCGPIAFLIPLNRKSIINASFQLFIYHFGRLISYSIIGFLFGILGKGLYLAGFQQRISIIAGLLILLITFFPSILKNKKFTKPIHKAFSIVKGKLGMYLKKKSNRAIFFIGIFNGFLPCGLVYMALIGSVAMAGSLKGAFFMTLFGLGTVPLMTIIVLFGNFVSISMRAKIQKVIPYFVIVIGLLFILRGLGLGIPYISPSNAKLQLSNNPAECITIDNNN